MDLTGVTLVGTVVNNEDPDEQSRVQVIFEGLNDLIPLEMVYWLTLSMPSGTFGNTLLDIPPIGSRVKVFFLSNNMASGIVIGMFSQWTPNSK